MYVAYSKWELENYKKGKKKSEQIYVSKEYIFPLKWNFSHYLFFFRFAKKLHYL